MVDQSMMAQAILVCMPGEDGAPIEPRISCGNVGGVPYFATVIKAHTLTTEQYQALVKSSAPFDTATGAGYFAFGLGVVVACWVLAHTAGLVLQSVRQF